MGKTVKDILKKPSLLFMTLGHRGVFDWMDDETYLKIAYRIATGYGLNLDNPKTFNEKLQWLKLYDRKPEYSDMVDKFKVKKYVADIIGEKYIIPTLGVWDHFDDIDFDALPDQFVLKCTHDSGGLVICKDKLRFDKLEAKKKINKCLKHNFYWGQREWPYKNVKPGIIAEQYMEDESGNQLKDYKIFNFNGEARIIQVDYDRFVNHRRNLYTPEWEYVDVEYQHRKGPDNIIKRPENLPEMLQLAQKLSINTVFLRTDFYSINGKVYFGEITFFPEAGFGRFVPEKYNYRLGQWISLPDHV